MKSSQDSHVLFGVGQTVGRDGVETTQRLFKSEGGAVQQGTKCRMAEEIV
jgi:hypothetical protein